MAKTKILFISSMSDYSGGEIVLNRLLLNNPSIEPVFAVPPGRFSEILIKEFNNVHVLPTLLSKGRVNTINYFINFLKNIYILYKLTKFERPDIVFANSLGVSVYSAILKVITTLPAMFVHHHPVMLKKSATYYIASILAILHSKVVTVSNAVKHSYPLTYIVQKKLITIYNGLLINKVKLALPNQQSEYSIGLVATITEWKGHHIVIDAIAYIRHIRPDIYAQLKILFVGEVLNNNLADQVYKKRIEKKICENDMGSRFIFTGKTSDMDAMYAKLDIVLNCSIKPEPFGTTIYEAMAQKKIVIATNMGGSIEIIDDGVNGYLIKPSDPIVLANQIIYVIDHNESIIEMREKAYNKVLSSFKVEDMKCNYTRLFKNIIDR